MIDRADADVSSGATGFSRTTFLASHRALAACSRQVALLAKELAAAANAYTGETGIERAVLRQSPDRCILQMGPVALTASWLRGASEPLADGQLLAIVWHGNVFPRNTSNPERATAKGPAAPVALWEEMLVITAESEESWLWHAGGKSSPGMTAQELARHIIGQLSAAHAKVTGSAPADSLLGAAV